MSLLILFKGGGATAYTQTNTGTLTSSGALTNRKTRYIFLVRVPPAMSGTLVRKTGKVFTAGVTPAGALIKKITKTLTAGITSSGALTALRAVLITLTGRIGGRTWTKTEILDYITTNFGITSASPLWIPEFDFSGSGNYDIVDWSITNAQSSGYTLRPAVTYEMSGALVKKVKATMAAGLAPIGTLAKKTSKTLTAGMTSAGTLVKRIGKTLRGTITSVGALSNIFAPLFPARITLTETLLYKITLTEDGE